MVSHIPEGAPMSGRPASSERVPTQPGPAGGQAPEAGSESRAAVVHTRTTTVRDAIHVGACMLGGVLITIAFLLDPATDVENGADLVGVVAETPDRFYVSTTLGAFGFAMTAAVGLAVLRLVHGRGRVLATVGGLMLTIAGVAAAAGLFMYGSVVTALVESGQDLTVVAGLQDSLEDSSRVALPFLVGFPGLLLGLVLCGVALLLSRAVPRWVPAVLLAGCLGVVVLGETALSSVADLLLTAGFLGIGLALWRATAAGRSG